MSSDASRSTSSKTMTGALPPSSRITGFGAAPASCGDRPARPGRSGERDQRDIRVGHERASGDRPTPLDDVHHAGWQDLRSELGESHRRDRGVLGRLDHDGVSGSQRRAIFHIACRSGKFHGVIAAITPTGSRRIMIVLPPTYSSVARTLLAARPGEVAQPGDDTGHLHCPRGRDRFAGVDAFQFGELVDPVGHQGSDGVQRLTASAWCHAGPVALGPPGGSDRRVDLLGGGLAQRGDSRAGRSG